MRIEALGKVIDARIRAVGLSKPLHAPTLDAVNHEVLEQLVVVFPH
jgi:hypothetical protein